MGSEGLLAPAYLVFHLFLLDEVEDSIEFLLELNQGYLFEIEVQTIPIFYRDLSASRNCLASFMSPATDFFLLVLFGVDNLLAGPRSTS